MILIDSGLFNGEELKQVQQISLEKKIDALIMVNDYRIDYCSKNQEIIKNCRTINYSEIFSKGDIEAINDTEECVLSYILNDSVSYAVAQRLRIGGRFPSIFNDRVAMHGIICRCINFIKKYKISKIVWTNTPHDWTWFLAITAEKMGVAVYYTRVINQLERVEIVKGLMKGVVVPRITKENYESSIDLKKIMEKYSGNYKNIIPKYELKNIKKYGSQRTLKARLLNILSVNKLDKLIFSLVNELCQAKYRKKYYLLSQKKIDKNMKYGLFFLHYQPERTTIPEGGIFYEQVEAIRKMASVLGENEILLVREHPSTFRLNFDFRYRNAKFIEAIASIKQVQFVDSMVDVFELIDKSRFVSTITGNVGFEALIRSCPVLIFGGTFYEKYCGVMRVFDETNASDIKSHIDNFRYNKDHIFSNLAITYANSFAYEVSNAGSLEAVKSLIY